MAHPAEPMDIDSIDSDFDNKENTFHHNNVQPCTEKGYEELDVSELNMRLRYSVTPAASPMSKSFSSCVDNRTLDSEDSLNTTVNEVNLTHSLNATMTKNDSVVKSLRALPFQSLPTDHSVEKNSTVLRQIDSIITTENNNVTVTVSGINDIEENVSLPSSSSSAIHTPDATTPINEIPKSDGSSPIMRGLKSVLNMFRSSQSPIPLPDNENSTLKQLTSTPTRRLSSEPREKEGTKPVLASTPIAAHRDKEGNGSKRSSPLKDSIIFNDDLEKELQWKDETTIIFSQEKIPIHKLFYQQKQNKASEIKTESVNMDTTVEYMDVSYNDPLIKDRTMTILEPEINKNECHVASESDSEFLDCETDSNVTKTHSYVLDNNEIEFNKEEYVKVQNIVNDVSVTDNEAVILQKIDETKKELLNMTDPIGIENNEDNFENQLLSSLIQDENIGINKSAIDNQTKCEDNLNMTKEIVRDSQQIKSETESILDMSGTNPESLNLDETMTMDYKKKKNNTICSNMFEVSTLESHTQSLSSLLKSLDIIESIDEDNKVNSEANNFLDVTKIMQHENKVNLEAINLEISTPKESILMPDSITQNPNVTITINDLDSKTFDTTGLTEAFNLNLPDYLPSTTIQNFNVTMNIKKQEKLMAKSNSLDILQDKVMDSTFKVTNENSKDILSMALPIVTPVKENMTQEASQIVAVESIPIIASPADAPLPDDDDIEKYMSSSTDTCVSITNDIPPPIVDKIIVETEVKMTVETLAEMNTNNTQLPDEVSEVKDSHNENSDTTTAQLVSVPGKEDISDSKISYSKINNILESQQKLQNITEIVQNFGTSDIQTPIVNESVENISELANINQSVNDAEIIALGVPESQINDHVGHENVINETCNTSRNLGNILPMSSNEQEKYVNDNNQINVGSIILPENEMETSISACEEILDKNREFSEVFHAEQMIDKLQHASDMDMDMALSSKEIKDESLHVSQNAVQKEMVSSETNITFKEKVFKADQFSEVKTNVITDLETQDTNKIITMEEDAKIANEEQNDISQQKLIHEKEINITERDIANKNDSVNETGIMEEDVNIANDEQKKISQQEVIHEKGIKINERDEVNENEFANKAGIIGIQIMNYIKGDNIEQEVIDEKEINNSLKDNKENANTTVKIETNVKTPNDKQKDIPKPEEIQEEQNKVAVQVKAAEKETQLLNLNDDLFEKLEMAITDNEIIVSGNNSPYVSVATGLDKVVKEKHLDISEEIEKSFDTRTNMSSSPPITSKGYNFNFDEIDDPFATKVKIRMSPETPNKTIEIKKEDKNLAKPDNFKRNRNKNIRKSQPVRQKISNTKRAFNATFDDSVNGPEMSKPQIKTDTKTKQNVKDVNVEERQNCLDGSMNHIIARTTISSDVNKKYHVLPVENITEVQNIDVDTEVTNNVTFTEEMPIGITMSDENKEVTESVTAPSNEIITTSSSEQSTYYSAGASSSESIKSRNVFNLPEIDDMNFNPFANKTKIRQSSPSDVDIDNSFATNAKVMSSPDSTMIMQQGIGDISSNNATKKENKCPDKPLEDKMETEPMEKDSSVNISNTTCSSKATDNDVTIREVNTEDEDTIEGPFLEADDSNEVKSDFDGENIDMMQFNECPAQEHDDNADGELFIDAEAFEFLLNQNKSNIVADSGKESLFLKFDPLFAKRMSSDSIVAALSRAQKGQSTPTRTPRHQRIASTSVTGPSTMNLTSEVDLNTIEATEDINTTVSKPMMVVTPAVNPAATLRKSVTPTRSNRRSITFTSPAMAVIDRLLSLSTNNSLVEQENTAPQVSREQNEAELALTQLREVLAEKEIHVYNLRSESKELRDRLTTLESQMNSLETEGQKRLRKINDLNEKLLEKTKMNKSMAVVVEEYERTIASLIAETEQDKKRHAEERISLMNERDEQTAHLTSMEVSFNDLHSKYEKSKQVIMNYKANEETYKQSLKEFEENVTKMQKNYELLKQHATLKLNHANEELQKINRIHEAEVLKLNAMIKRKELHITSLEETLAQKTKANEELTAICDELINKVG